MVEHSAVNRVVVGSSPTRGAKRQWDDVQVKLVSISVYGFFFVVKNYFKPGQNVNGR